MSNAFDHENTPAGGFGEFVTSGTDDWTEEDWRQYDLQVAQEIAEWEAQTEPFDEFMADDSIEPPF